MSEDIKQKQWKKVKVLNTYELASELKSELINEDETGELLVKIRRCGPGGTQFKVKTWIPSQPKNNKKK